MREIEKIDKKHAAVTKQRAQGFKPEVIEIIQNAISNDGGSNNFHEIQNQFLSSDQDYEYENDEEGEEINPQGQNILSDSEDPNVYSNEES